MKIISRIVLIIFLLLFISLIVSTIMMKSELIIPILFTIFMLSILCYIIKILKK